MSAFGCQPAGYNSELKFIITGSLCQVQETIADASFHIYCALQYHMKNIVMAMITAYIALYFIALVLRMTTMKEGWPKMIKMVIILCICYQPDTFYELCYKMAMNTLHGFSELMMEMLPDRDIHGRLVYNCPPGTANMKGNPGSCEPIYDCTDVAIINPAYVTTANASDPFAAPSGIPPEIYEPKPNKDNFGRFLMKDAANGDKLIRQPGLPDDPTFKEPIGWKIIPTVNKMCRFGIQTGCILDCSTVGPGVLEPQVLLKECKGDPKNCDPEIRQHYLCGGMMTNNIACFPVPRQPVPTRSVFESYDVLFQELVGYDFLTSIIAYMIALILSFLGIGIVIAILSFVGITAAVWAFIRMFEAFLVSIMALTFTLMFAPIFVPMALFQFTFPLFKRWVTAIIDYILRPVLILAFLLLTAGLTDITDLKNGLATRGIHLGWDEYNLFSDIAGLPDFMNLDISFQAPKFLILKKDESPTTTFKSFSMIKFNTNIKEQSYFSFVQRLATLEGGGNPAATNLQGYAGLFQFGQPALKGLGIYTCDPTECADPYKSKHCEAGGCYGGMPADGKKCACEKETGNPDCCKMAWTGQFNGWMGICSIEDYLNNPDAQVLSTLMSVPGQMAGTTAFSNLIGKRIWDAPGTANPSNSRAQPHKCKGFLKGVKEPKITLAGLVAGIHMKGNLSGLAGAQIICPCADCASPCTECESVLGAGNPSCADRCGLSMIALDPCPSGAPGTYGCGPYGATTDCVAILPRVQDGSSPPLDMRDRFCDLHDIEINPADLSSRAAILSKLKNLNGDSIPPPTPGPVPNPCPPPGSTDPYVAPPNPGRTGIVTPPAKPDALKKIYAAVVAFTLAWVLVGKITAAFHRKLPEIAAELSTWSGQKTTPIIGGQSASMETLGGGSSDPLAPAQSQAGRSGFYTLEGAAFDLFRNVQGVARGRTSRPNQMGYTVDGKRATKSQGGLFKRRALNQWGPGKFFGAGEGGGGVTGWASRKGGGRLRQEFDTAKGYMQHRDAVKNASVMRRSNTLADYLNFRKGSKGGGGGGGGAPSGGGSGGGSRSSSHGGGSAPWSSRSREGSEGGFVSKALGISAVAGLSTLLGARNALGAARSGGKKDENDDKHSPWSGETKGAGGAPWSGSKDGKKDEGTSNASWSGKPEDVRRGGGSQSTSSAGGNTSGSGSKKGAGGTPWSGGKDGKEGKEGGMFSKALGLGTVAGLSGLTAARKALGAERSSEDKKEGGGTPWSGQAGTATGKPGESAKTDVMTGGAPWSGSGTKDAGAKDSGDKKEDKHSPWAGASEGSGIAGDPRRTDVMRGGAPWALSQGNEPRKEGEKDDEGHAPWAGKGHTPWSGGGGAPWSGSKEEAKKDDAKKDEKKGGHTPWTDDDQSTT